MSERADLGLGPAFPWEDIEMPSPVTYGQLRTVLAGMGFREIRKPEGVALRHAKSNTLFIFRPYQDSERMQFAEIDHVRFMLDQRGLLLRSCRREGPPPMSAIKRKVAHDLRNAPRRRRRSFRLP